MVLLKESRSSNIISKRFQTGLFHVGRIDVSCTLMKEDRFYDFDPDEVKNHIGCGVDIHIDGKRIPISTWASFRESYKSICFDDINKFAIDMADKLVDQLTDDKILSLLTMKYDDVLENIIGEMTEPSYADLVEF